MVTIKTGFSRVIDTKLLTQTQTIIDSMTLNVADYATPNPTLATVQTAKNKFETAKSDKGSKTKTSAKNDFRKALIVLLNNEALYVQSVCGDDATKALRSGFDIRKSRSKVGDLPKPSYFKVGAGKNSGEIACSMQSFQTKAMSYVYRYSQVEGTAPETWQTITSSNSKALLVGLTSGKKISVQGAGVGASKHLVWSDIITIYVM